MTGDPTNEQRVLAAEAALDGWRRAKGENEDTSNFEDLLADLMHLAVGAGIDFEAALSRARINHAAEATD
jgi:hypothetical protein